MTIEEFKASRFYRLLTPAEQQWIVEYFSTDGDVEAATTKAFNTATLQSTRTLGRRVLQRPAVASAINYFYGEVDDPKEELKVVLREILRGGRSDASKVSAARLLAELEGWVSKNGKKEDESGKENPADFLKEF